MLEDPSALAATRISAVISSDISKEIDLATREMDVMVRTENKYISY